MIMGVVQNKKHRSSGRFQRGQIIEEHVMPYLVQRGGEKHFNEKKKFSREMPEQGEGRSV